jgi:hypothetical protein
VFLQGIFNVLWCPNVVFWMVKRGGGVVFVWLEVHEKAVVKMRQLFLLFLRNSGLLEKRNRRAKRRAFGLSKKIAAKS